MSILGHSSLPAARAVRAWIGPTRAALPALLGLLLSWDARATEADAPGPLDAGVPPGPPTRTGEFIVYAPRPPPTPDLRLRACSFRHPICVHGGHPAETLALLDAADRAWDVATGALDLPAPDPSLATGALDLYLVEGDADATRTLLDRRDPASGFDRASAFALVGRGGPPGCALDLAAARVVTRAVLFRVAPATDEGSALAESAYLASLMVPCAAGDRGARALFQAHPEAGITGAVGPFVPPGEAISVTPTTQVDATPAETFAEGASLFYDWVDGRFGAYPGAIVRAMWALAPTVTPPGASRWNDEPDGFEVLRASFKGTLTTGSTVDDLWLDFAVARAFIPGSPVRFDWSVAWPEQPRTLMSGVGVAPTGAAYVSIDCAGRPKGARLRVEARWEELARILWTLVKIDAAGQEIGRVAVMGRERGTEAQTTLVDLDGAARVLLVGASAGDPRIAVDPDDYRLEPHGWTVSLASE